MLLYDRLPENYQFFNSSLWESNGENLFVSSPWQIWMLIFAFHLYIVGFGLLYFIAFKEPSLRLHAVTVFFMMICSGGSIIAFIIKGQDVTQTKTDKIVRLY